ncbi:MAG: HTH domain-containing protein, partial [Succinivibrionaceae bacterium]|nr:HTH domain-containing protein [Succinivibrionaceae bacterium]
MFDQDSISPDGGQETRNGGLDGGQETGNGGLDGGQKARNGGLAIRIVNSLKINKYVTLQQIADSLKVSKRAVEREVRKLQSNGVVSREGGTRHGYW